LKTALIIAPAVVPRPIGDDLQQIPAILNGHVAGRNSLRQPAFFDEVFNVTRATNLNFGPDAIGAYGTAAQPVATAGAPLFAPSTARFGGPRQVQVGMRVVF